MDRIYIYEGEAPKGKAGDNLIKECLAMYKSEQNLDMPETEIVRPEMGKPYFKDDTTEFSLSHSGSMWICVFSDSPVGIDIQEMKKVEYEKLTKKYFTDQEVHYVDLWGEDGFFDLWVRREALVKVFGKSVFSKIPCLVDEKSDLKECVVLDDKEIYFTDIQVGPDIKCVAAGYKKIDLEMRLAI